MMSKQHGRISRKPAARMLWLAPLAVAGTLAMAVVPTAHASSDPATCRDSGAAKICQRPGHTSLHTSPKVTAPSGTLFGSAWLPGYGRGQLPPLIALD